MLDWSDLLGPIIDLCLIKSDMWRLDYASTFRDVDQVVVGTFIPNELANQSSRLVFLASKASLLRDVNVRSASKYPKVGDIGLFAELPIFTEQLAYLLIGRYTL